MKRFAKYKNMLVVVVFFALLAGGLNSSAEVFSAQWPHVTLRSDGTALNPSELAGYRIYYHVDAPVDGSETFQAVMKDDNTVNITIVLQPRSQPYQVYFALTAVDTDGQEGALQDIPGSGTGTEQAVVTVDVPLAGPAKAQTITITIISL